MIEIPIEILGETVSLFICGNCKATVDYLISKNMCKYCMGQVTKGGKY